MPGVPDTTTFTLADVVAAVLPSSNDLQECFDDSVDGAFDSAYGPGDKKKLLQFRNYGNDIAAQNMVYITTSQFSPSGACSASRTVKAWKGSNPRAVNNGEKFWYNEVVNGVDTPGDPYVGGGEFQFFGIFTGLNSASFKLSSLGIVTNKVFCNLPSKTLPDVSYVTGYSQSGGLVLSTPVDYYYDSSIGDAENLTPGDILYTDANLTTPLGGNTGLEPTNYLQWTGTSTSTDICQDPTNSPGAIIYLTNTTNGVISSIGCAYL